MSHADVYVSMHGASIPVNIIYMQPETILVEVLANSSYKELLSLSEQAMYRTSTSHWSARCPWNYFPSLNLPQALGLRYKCLATPLPKGERVIPRKYAPNYPCEVCVACVVSWLERLRDER